VKVEKRKGQRAVILGIIILVLLGVLLVALDWHNVRRLIGEANWKLSLYALLFVAITYLLLSYGFVLVNRIFGIGMKQRELFQIGYVSTALNNIVAFLGAAGHSLRVMVMQRKGVKPEQALAASVFHSHFHNLVMFCLLPLGIIYMLIHHSVSGASAIGLELATALIILLVVVATIIIFIRSLRLVVLRILNRVFHLVTRKSLESSLSTFDKSMTLGVAAIKNRPMSLVPVLVFIIADWASSVAVLWFCFDAMGNTVSLDVLITGYAVGITVGNLSMIPGGLGVQEASMAGVYALLGVSFELAVMVSILFRVVFDFIPFIISVFFYRSLLRSSKKLWQQRTMTGHKFSCI
jgi:uncharacterized protein (TIRG00374 family)